MPNNPQKLNLDNQDEDSRVKIHHFLLFFITVFAICFSSAVRSSECGNAYEYFEDRIVRVGVQHGGHGTGFIVKTNKILTAKHVVWVEQSKFYEITGKGMNHRPDYLDRPVAITRADKADIAEVWIRTQKIKTTKIFDGMLLPGDKVWVAGYASVYPWVIVEGIVNTTLEPGFNKWTKAHTTIITGEFAQGMSGGPVLICRDGEFQYAGTISAMGVQSVPMGWMPLRLPLNFIGFVMSPFEVRKFLNK